jgi:hypothetical protein
MSFSLGLRRATSVNDLADQRPGVLVAGNGEHDRAGTSPSSSHSRAVLGVVDVAFLVFLVVPGYVDLIGGMSGPAIWLMATACATVALRREPVST